MILALAITRQVHILVAQIRSHQEFPDIEGDEISAVAHKWVLDSRKSKHHFLAISEAKSLHERTVRQLDVLYTEGQRPILAAFVFRAAYGAHEEIQYGGVLRLEKHHFWMPNGGRKCVCA